MSPIAQPHLRAVRHPSTSETPAGASGGVAIHILGRRALGFTHELFDDSGELEPETAASLASELGATLPYVAEMVLAVTHGGALGRCDDNIEFEFALDFILDGLDRLRGS